MSDTLTSNGNLLSPIGWKLHLTTPTFKNLEFTVVSVTMPGISLTPIEVNYKNNTPFVPSEKITWDALEVRVIANEDLENYTEVFDWILKNKGNDLTEVSDVILSILTSHKNLNKQFRFNQAFPSALGGFELTTSAEGVEYIQFSVTFRYDTFELIL